MTDKPRAYVTNENGQHVLHDPEALAVVHVVERENCRRMMAAMFADRLRHFERRIHERGLTPADAIIVVLNVDDFYGAMLTEQLMPGQDWQPFRDRGEVPYARGLATRHPLQVLLDGTDAHEAQLLRGITGTAVLCADRGIVAVYDLCEILVDATT